MAPAKEKSTGCIGISGKQAHVFTNVLLVKKLE